MCRSILGKWYGLPLLVLLAACGGGGGGAGPAAVILGVLQAAMLGTLEPTVIDPAAHATAMEIGRASCRERV